MIAFVHLVNVLVGFNQVHTELSKGCRAWVTERRWDFAVEVLNPDKIHLICLLIFYFPSNEIHVRS